MSRFINMLLLSLSKNEFVTEHMRRYHLDQTNEFLPHATAPVKITVTFDSVCGGSEAHSGGHGWSGGGR